ncbi:MAG: alkaline phosphatase D family protein, partial [Deltaproteobacteria bacterium]|nr:alkaline phosphatase D family protein [Deltaproteobacteria bacterium]
MKPTTGPDGTGDGKGGTASESEEVNLAVFPFAVMAGDMEATSSSAARAVFWTRCMAAGPLHLTVWDKETLEIVFEDVVEVADAGFAHQDVTTLEPGVRYRYQFAVALSGDEAAFSTAGEVMMPPAPGSLPVVTFGAVSCTHQGGEAGFQAIGLAANLEIDCFFHLGDHVYNDAREWLTTLDQFRDSWQECFDLEYMRNFHAKHGLYFTWDDHEIINNWDWDWVDANPVFRDSVKFGTQTYFEHHPLRRNPTDANRLWRSVKWGDTAEFFVLDLRSERREDINRHMLSPAQMKWLKDAIAKSTAKFKIVMNPIPICTMPPEDAHLADRWEGFDRERTEILGWIRDQHIEGVWWISGDYHVGSVGQIDQYG